ncbi:hypothetical protein [uncultured Bartonella sp.]|nr:hypothetical protein [uncultured Bartonella sp.]
MTNSCNVKALDKLEASHFKMAIFGVEIKTLKSTKNRKPPIEQKNIDIV